VPGAEEENVTSQGSAVLSPDLTPADSLLSPYLCAKGATLSLLGGFDLQVDEHSVQLPRRAQRLLVFLALHTRPLARAYVADCLWLDASEGHAHGNLRSALWKLGHAGCPLVAINAGCLSLDAGVTVDLHRSLHVAHRLLEGGRGLAGDDLDESLLVEDVLPDWSEEWVLEERERYRQLRLHALELLCERLTSLRNFGHAVQTGLAAVAAEPLRESAQRVLIHAYLAEGNACEARRQYARYQSLLSRELGQEPSIEMRGLIAMGGDRVLDEVSL
jgi:DNA-binding SARP family transcriptional activator